MATEKESSSFTGILLCPMCNKSFSNDQAEAEKQLHVNTCLDESTITNDELLARTLQLDESATVVQEDCYFCSLCCKNLSNFNSKQRQVHMNQCADKCEKFEKPNTRKRSKNAVKKDKETTYQCQFCEKPIIQSKVTAHMKRCAKKNKIAASELLKCLRKLPNTIVEKIETAGSSNRRDVKKKIPINEVPSATKLVPTNSAVVTNILNTAKEFVHQNKSSDEITSTPQLPASRIAAEDTSSDVYKTCHEHKLWNICSYQLATESEVFLLNNLHPALKAVPCEQEADKAVHEESFTVTQYDKLNILMELNTSIVGDIQHADGFIENNQLQDQELEIMKTKCQTKLIEDMMSLLESSINADVNIKCADEITLPAHKLILTMRAKAMLQFIPSDTCVLDLSMYSPISVSIFLKYIYTGQFMKDDITEDSIGRELYELAKKFDIELLVQCCGILYPYSSTIETPQQNDVVADFWKSTQKLNCFNQEDDDLQNNDDKLQNESIMESNIDEEDNDSCFSDDEVELMKTVFHTQLRNDSTESCENSSDDDDDDDGDETTTTTTTQESLRVDTTNEDNLQNNLANETGSDVEMKEINENNSPILISPTEHVSNISTSISSKNVEKIDNSPVLHPVISPIRSRISSQAKKALVNDFHQEIITPNIAKETSPEECSHLNINNTLDNNALLDHNTIDYNTLLHQKTIDYNTSLVKNTIDNNTLDHNAIDNSTLLDNKTIDNNSLDHSTIDNKTLDNNAIDNNTLLDQNTLAELDDDFNLSEDNMEMIESSPPIVSQRFKKDYSILSNPSKSKSVEDNPENNYSPIRDTPFPLSCDTPSICESELNETAAFECTITNFTSEPTRLSRRESTRHSNRESTRQSSRESTRHSEMESSYKNQTLKRKSSNTTQHLDMESNSTVINLYKESPEISKTFSTSTFSNLVLDNSDNEIPIDESPCVVTQRQSQTLHKTTLLSYRKNNSSETNISSSAKNSYSNTTSLEDISSPSSTYNNDKKKKRKTRKVSKEPGVHIRVSSSDEVVTEDEERPKKRRSENVKNNNKSTSRSFNNSWLTTTNVTESPKKKKLAPKEKKPTPKKRKSKTLSKKKKSNEDFKSLLKEVSKNPFPGDMSSSTDNECTITRNLINNDSIDVGQTLPNDLNTSCNISVSNQSFVRLKKIVNSGREATFVNNIDVEISSSHGGNCTSNQVLNATKEEENLVNNSFHDNSIPDTPLEGEGLCNNSLHDTPLEKEDFSNKSETVINNSSFNENMQYDNISYNLDDGGYNSFMQDFYCPPPNDSQNNGDDKNKSNEGIIVDNEITSLSIGKRKLSKCNKDTCAPAEQDEKEEINLSAGNIADCSVVIENLSSNDINELSLRNSINISNEDNFMFDGDTSFIQSCLSKNNFKSPNCQPSLKSPKSQPKLSSTPYYTRRTSKQSLTNSVEKTEDVSSGCKKQKASKKSTMTKIQHNLPGVSSITKNPTVKTPINTEKNINQSFAPGCSIHPDTNMAITPMPDYSMFPTPQLKIEMKNFALRDMAKNKMVAKMKEIYKYTHNFETWEVELKKKEKKKVNKKKSKPTESPSKLTIENHAESKLKKENHAESVADEDKTTAKPKKKKGENESKKKANIDNEELKKFMMDMIRNDEHLHQQVLSYEPVELANLVATVQSKDIKCSKRQIELFLDNQCICFYDEASQQQNRYTKKPRKTTAKKKLKEKT